MADYDKYSLNELEEMLNAVIENYNCGDIHYSLYTILFNELHDIIAQRKKGPPVDFDNAYNRAMQGI